MNPLVEPGPPLTPKQAERYSRHLLLPALGEIAQRRLLAARVAVVGAGGLGSPALLYLAAAGVGTLGIVDDDVVEVTNLQRQVLHGVADVGRSKLDSATERLRAIAPDLVIEPRSERLTAANATEILRDYDLVLDGTDTFETRYAVSDACAELGIPLVWGSVLAFDAQVSVFWARAAGGTTLRDLFPDPPAPGTVPSCAEAGVLGSLTGQVGSVMATEAIKLITGVGEPLLGRVLVLDALAQRWTEVPLRARDETSPIPRDDRAPRPASAPAPAQASDAVDVEQVREAIARGVPITLLDVREPYELVGGAIPDSMHVPLAHVLTEGGRRSIPREGIVVAYCQVGPRAEKAAAELRGAGIEARWLVGGYPAWAAAQHEGARA